MQRNRHRFRGLALVIVSLVFSPLTALSQEVVTQKEISLDLAQGIAQAALDSCRAANFHTVVIVLDTSGAIKVMLRDDKTGPHLTDITRKKAYTALTFKGNTSDQVKIWETQKFPNIGPDRIPLPGGVAIKAGNDVIGAIGVGGAPGGEKDEACALAAVAKYADKLK